MPTEGTGNIQANCPFSTNDLQAIVSPQQQNEMNKEWQNRWINKLMDITSASELKRRLKGITKKGIDSNEATEEWMKRELTNLKIMNVKSTIRLELEHESGLCT